MSHIKLRSSEKVLNSCNGQVSMLHTMITAPNLSPMHTVDPKIDESLNLLNTTGAKCLVDVNKYST